MPLRLRAFVLRALYLQDPRVSIRTWSPTTTLFVIRAGSFVMSQRANLSCEALASATDYRLVSRRRSTTAQFQASPCTPSNKFTEESVPIAIVGDVRNQAHAREKKAHHENQPSA
jgi:hypothetical protein